MNRFEKLYGYTAFWSTDEPGNVPADGFVTAPVFTYNCGIVEFMPMSLLNAISIRCIMDVEDAVELK
jgi:hypothetical protein